MKLISERHIDELGRIVLPIEVRKKHNLQPGDSLVVCLDPEGRIILYTKQQWQELLHTSNP